MFLMEELMNKMLVTSAHWTEMPLADVISFNDIGHKQLLSLMLKLIEPRASPSSISPMAHTSSQFKLLYHETKYTVRNVFVH